MKGDFGDRLARFGTNNFLIPLPFIGRQGVEDWSKYREECFRSKMSDVGMEAMQVKGVQGSLN